MTETLTLDVALLKKVQVWAGEFEVDGLVGVGSRTLHDGDEAWMDADGRLFIYTKVSGERFWREIDPLGLVIVTLIP